MAWVYVLKNNKVKAADASRVPQVFPLAAPHQVKQRD